MLLTVQHAGGHLTRASRRLWAEYLWMASLTSALLTCRTEKDAKADEAYFDSYGYFDIHRTMLGDEVWHHSLLCMANF